MPPAGCSSGLLATALAALLLVPTPPWTGVGAPRTVEPAPRGATSPGWLLAVTQRAPPGELAATSVLLALALWSAGGSWLRRRLLERRTRQLGARLAASGAKLRAWAAQQARLEATLHMVRGAAAEYNLLLYLLLRERRAAAPAPASTPAHV